MIGHAAFQTGFIQIFKYSDIYVYIVQYWKISAGIGMGSLEKYHQLMCGGVKSFEWDWLALTGHDISAVEKQALKKCERKVTLFRKFTARKQTIHVPHAICGLLQLYTSEKPIVSPYLQGCCPQELLSSITVHSILLIKSL